MDTGQGAQRFYISETNPNDAIGGGGCLCSEGRCEDRGGPYAVFHVTETDSTLSPHVVLCSPCARAVVGQLDGEAIVAGEPTIELPDADVVEADTWTSTHENPVTEGAYPNLDDEELSI